MIAYTSNLSNKKEPKEILWVQIFTFEGYFLCHL